MSELGERLLELCFPTRCCFCRRLSGRGRPVCRACAVKYPDLLPAQRERALSPRLRCLSPLRYEGEVRGSLLRFKFRNRPGYAAAYANFMRKCLDESGVSCDSITWVPLSARRLRERGYDQARLLAEELARTLGRPCVRLLEKTRHTKAQSSLRTREQRRENVRGVYRALDPGQIAGRRILLVDDIVTSGATMCECARVLRAAGAADVVCVTAASRME